MALSQPVLYNKDLPIQSVCDPVAQSQPVLYNKDLPIQSVCDPVAQSQPMLYNKDLPIQSVCDAVAQSQAMLYNKDLRMQSVCDPMAQFQPMFYNKNPPELVTAVPLPIPRQSNDTTCNLAQGPELTEATAACPDTDGFSALHTSVLHFHGSSKPPKLKKADSQQREVLQPRAEHDREVAERTRDHVTLDMASFGPVFGYADQEEPQDTLWR
ncbi:hypothetical protein WISP_16553 [Willisornis vidua]|uniref:Uncharacterized protein n=1 Tax=Willisornis vidua TaxID=1566151 RepID=A0ABQ9DR95_9PASS|nr:hypothetical protein WISP_16553 [Willisornis vidua]